MRSGVCFLALAAALCLSPDARAALTDSEKAQIAGFIRSGDVKRAARVRSLIARPDLSAVEAAAPLVSAYRASVFDAARAELTRSLLFGPGSEAARSTLVGGVVTALLARAERALGDLPRTADELVRIHAFVAKEIGQSGTLVRDEARKQAALAYHQHLEQNAKWLVHGSRMDRETVLVRAQAQLAALELGRHAFSKHDLGAWLGLSGARKRAFMASGVLLEDGGTASEARLDLAVRLLEAAPAPSAGPELWLIHKAPTAALVTRRPILRARTPLGATPRPVDGAGKFGAEVTPARLDAELAEIAHAVAWQATRAAFEKNAELSTVAERLAADSSRVGRAAYLAPALLDSRIGPEGSPEGARGASALLFTAHLVHLVLLDAPRAATVAALRSLAGRNEPAAQLALALGVLARDSAELTVGQSDASGALSLIRLRDVKRAGALVTSFSLDEDRFDLGVRADGSAGKLTINGAAPIVSKLALARLSPSGGEKWTSGGVEWTRLFGEPQALGLDDGRLILAAAQKSTGFDSVIAGRDAVDTSVRAKLEPSGAGGGVVLRAKKGGKSYDGVALLISAEPARAELVLVDGEGRAVELAPPIDLPAPEPGGFDVTFAVTGSKVSASVGGKKLEAKLTRAPGSGKVALTARRGGRIEIQALSGPTLAGKKK